MSDALYPGGPHDSVVDSPTDQGLDQTGVGEQQPRRTPAAIAPRSLPDTTKRNGKKSKWQRVKKLIN